MLKQQIRGVVVMRLVLFSPTRTFSYVCERIEQFPQLIPNVTQGRFSWCSPSVKEATEKVLHLFPNTFHTFFPQMDMWNKSHAVVKHSIWCVRFPFCFWMRGFQSEELSKWLWTLDADRLSCEVLLCVCVWCNVCPATVQPSSCCKVDFLIFLLTPKIINHMSCFYPSLWFIFPKNEVAP